MLKWRRQDRDIATEGNRHDVYHIIQAQLGPNNPAPIRAESEYNFATLPKGEDQATGSLRQARR